MKNCWTLGDIREATAAGNCLVPKKLSTPSLVWTCFIRINRTKFSPLCYKNGRWNHFDPIGQLYFIFIFSSLLLFLYKCATQSEGSVIYSRWSLATLFPITIIILSGSLPPLVNPDGQAALLLEQHWPLNRLFVVVLFPLHTLFMYKFVQKFLLFLQTLILFLLLYFEGVIMKPSLCHVSPHVLFFFAGWEKKKWWRVLNASGCCYSLQSWP